MNGEKENKTFAGETPRNRTIIERIRKEGYYALLFRQEDFMEGVAWAANVVNDFKKYVRLYRDRIVIPFTEISFRKGDLINAHFIMIFYYKMKKNLVQVEELKEGLFTVAKLQNVQPEDVEIMKRWDNHILLAKTKQDSGDLSAVDIGALRGTEVKYERYSGIVAKEVSKFQEDLAKL